MNTYRDTGKLEPQAANLHAGHQALGVDAAVLKDWLMDGDAFLVDVREPAEYEKSRIDGAFLMPVSRVDTTSFPRLPALKTVLVCQNGFLAPVARDELIAAGFSQVYALNGGLNAWLACGLEIEE